MGGRITLKDARDFHGHLGPYLVLGILAGEIAIQKIGCKKYFGLKVNVYGANKKPKSCLIDGLQLSTGATYGKGNINKFAGSGIKIKVQNKINNKKVILRLKRSLVKKLEMLKTHQDSKLLARELYKTNYSQLFILTT
jgi:formylmethanofuran dehydrogenase subunit E